MKPVLDRLTLVLSIMVLGMGAALATPTSTPPIAGVETGSTRAPASHQGESLSADPYLRERLPQGTVAYLRIPNPWVSLFGQPQGNLFSKALGSAGYVETVTELKEGLVALFLPEVQPELRPLIELLVEHAASPIEAVVLPTTAGGGVPGEIPARILATLKLDLESTARLSQLLTAIVLNRSDMELLSPLDAGGYARLRAGRYPLALHYDADSARLWLLSSLNSQQGEPSDLKQVEASLQPHSAHPMHRVEADLDAAGQGLFLWLDPMPTISLAQAMGGGGEAAGLALIGLTEARALALGMGVSRGKSRLAVRLDMPQVGFRSFFPAVTSELDLEVAGEPVGALVLALPDNDDLRSIEGILAAMAPPEQMVEYFAAKESLRTDLGIDIEEILTALGEEAILIGDEAGIYWALEIDDWELAEKATTRILSKLAERGYQIEQSAREIDGRTYHHARIPPLSFLADPTMPREQGLDALLARLMNQPSHAYWVNEGDYHLVARLPQVLIDRADIAARTPLRDWLHATQGVDAEGALLLATLRSSGTPRLLYHFMLQGLEYIGDLVERPVDLFALPSAREAELTGKSGYSVQFDSTADRLAIEISYDGSPLDFLIMGGGYQGIAMLGILSAIALPAYQDYAIRSQVDAVLQQSSIWQQSIDEFHASMGRFPDEAEITAFGVGLESDLIEGLSITPDSGIILLEVAIDGLPADATLILEPQPGPRSGLKWVCSGMEPKYLPTSCRP